MLGTIVVGVAILVTIGFMGARYRRYPGQGLPESTIAATDMQDPADRIRREFEEAGFDGVPDHLIDSLSSLTKIDDYPIYTMTYIGPYVHAADFQDAYGVNRESVTAPSTPTWACSLFGAVGDVERPMMGRNFDWQHSPILVAFLDPEDSYRSMVSIDLAYVVDEDLIDRLDEVRAEELIPLLNVPFITFDGMNEHGLAIGMASVDYECGYPSDPNKRDVGDMRLMREVLDHCTTVEESLAFLEGINPVSQGGPNMHFLIADRTPSAALIEYHEGETYIFRSTEDEPWQLGTNFPVVRTNGNPAGECWRYDTIAETLENSQGEMTSLQAMELLQHVATETTQWSIVYDLGERIMNLAVRRDLDTIYSISLDSREVLQQRSAR